MIHRIKDWRVTISTLLVGLMTYGITRSFGGWPFPKTNLINDLTNLGMIMIITFIMIAYLSKYILETTNVKVTKKKVKRKSTKLTKKVKKRKKTKA